MNVVEGVEVIRGTGGHLDVERMDDGSKTVRDPCDIELSHAHVADGSARRTDMAEEGGEEGEREVNNEFHEDERDRRGGKESEAEQRKRKRKKRRAIFDAKRAGMWRKINQCEIPRTEDGLDMEKLTYASTRKTLRNSRAVCGLPFSVRGMGSENEGGRVRSLLLVRGMSFGVLKKASAETSSRVGTWSIPLNPQTVNIPASLQPFELRVRGTSIVLLVIQCFRREKRFRDANQTHSKKETGINVFEEFGWKLRHLITDLIVIRC